MNQQPSRVNILGIPGSLRRASFNRLLLDAAADLAPASTVITVFDGMDQIPVFNEDLEAPGRIPEGVAQLRRALSESDGVLLSTPEYNQSVPGAVKNLIDWLSRSEAEEGLTGRPMAVIGATTGPWGTRIAQTSLRQMLASVGAPVMPQPTMFVANAAPMFDGDGRLTDAETRDRLASVVVALGEWAQRIRGPFNQMTSGGLASV